MRAVSTAVDATLFLLVVGVAVATLVGVPTVVDEGPVDRADAIAEHLATGTERVEYSLAPAARALDGEPPVPIHDGPPYVRSAHGTLASLLADASVATLTIDGERIGADGDAYRTAVVNATEHRVRNRNVSVHVHASWEPYPGAPIAGEVHAGRRPPATVDVMAATVVIDGPIPASRERAITAARTDGFEGVASAVANATVRGLFPPEKTRLALRGEYPVDALVADRYVETVEALGGEPGRPTAGSDVQRLRAHLADRLAERLAEDLRKRFDVPADAARNVSTGTATVTVRTWSR